ncbi:MAG: hypothetical protein R2867_19515 [Caldilineaceae bacterium]
MITNWRLVAYPSVIDSNIHSKLGLRRRWGAAAQLVVEGNYCVTHGGIGLLKEDRSALR